MPSPCRLLPWPPHLTCPYSEDSASPNWAPAGTTGPFRGYWSELRRVLPFYLFCLFTLPCTILFAQRAFLFLKHFWNLCLNRTPAILLQSTTHPHTCLSAQHFPKSVLCPQGSDFRNDLTTPHAQHTHIHTHTHTTHRERKKERIWQKQNLASRIQ